MLRLDGCGRPSGELGQRLPEPSEELQAALQVLSELLGKKQAEMELGRTGEYNGASKLIAKHPEIIWFFWWPF